MAETWLMYSELAQALDISAEAARQKAIRGGWRRQRGNDGKARILVDLEVEKAAHTPRRRPDKRLDEHPDEHPDERRTFEALEAHIATLKEAVTKAEARDCPDGATKAALAQAREALRLLDSGR